MKIGIVTRPGPHWGGDLKAVAATRAALASRGHEVSVVRWAGAAKGLDFAILTNTQLDLRANWRALSTPYSVLCFHEDVLAYTAPCTGFLAYVRLWLKGERDNGVPYSLERLVTAPSTALFYPTAGPPRAAVWNAEVMAAARACVTSSPTEMAHARRDFPFACVRMVRWEPEDPELAEVTPDTAVFGAYGAEQGSYAIQVGRLESRKNQLASVLACARVGVPLVLVAPTSADRDYEHDVVRAAARVGCELLLIRQGAKETNTGSVRVRTSGPERLSLRALKALYLGARCLVHPAFMEAPGYTYLEAAQLGVPIVGSTFAAARDYVVPGTATWVPPYDVAALARAVESASGAPQLLIGPPDFAGRLESALLD